MVMMVNIFLHHSSGNAFYCHESNFSVEMRAAHRSANHSTLNVGRRPVTSSSDDVTALRSRRRFNIANVFELNDCK